MAICNEHVLVRYLSACAAIGLLLSVPVTRGIAAERVPSSGRQSIADKADFLPLFNGRDFQGWQQAGNWQIAEGAFYGASVRQGRGDLHLTAMRIPGNCELVFEWKEDKDIDWKALGLSRPYRKRSPGFVIGFNVGSGTRRPNASYGVCVDYCVSGVGIRLHTRSVLDNLPAHEFEGSGLKSSVAVKDFSKPVGQWNQSRIVCKDSRVQFWLNDSLAFDLNINEEEATTSGGGVNRFLPEWAIKQWLGRVDRGLFLSVIGPENQTPATTIRVDIRSLAVRPLKAREQPAEVEIFPSRVGKSPTNPNGVRWDWRSDPLYARLTIAPKDLPPGCAICKRIESFGPAMGMTNPGGTTNPDLIVNRFPACGSDSPELTKSDVTSVFFCRYEERDEICVDARQLSSPEKAKLFRILVSEPREANGRTDVWVIRNYVITLDAGPKVSAVCYRAFQEHIERVVADVSRKP